MTRTKKAIKNSVFGILQQLVNIITNMILPPIIIATFGSAINGLIATIKQLMGYVQLVGAGLSAATIEALYKPLANNDEKKINGCINATNKAFNNSGIFFSLIIVIISCIYPYFLDKTEINYVGIMLLIVIIGITGASEFFVVGKYRTLLMADQKMFVVSLAQMLVNLLTIITTVVLVYLKQNIIIIQLFASGIYVLRTIIIVMYVRKNYKYLDKKVEPILSAVSKRKDAMFHQLAATVVVGSTTIIISIFCGLEAASIYSIYALIFNGILLLCASLSNSLVPSFGEIVAKDDKNSLKKAFAVYNTVYYIIVFVLFAVAFVTILPFISIYTKGFDISYINPVLATLFIVIGIINNLKVPSDTIITAHGDFKETKHMAVWEMIINLIGQLIFVKIWGLEGVLLGTLCSGSYRTIASMWYTNKKILNISNKIIVKKILVNLISTFVPAYIISKFFDFNCDGYIDWIIKAGILTIIISITSLLLNYITDKETINGLIFRLKNLVKKQI